MESNHGYDCVRLCRAAGVAFLVIARELLNRAVFLWSSPKGLTRIRSCDQQPNSALAKRSGHISRARRCSRSSKVFFRASLVTSA
jgi:hypothetical protein